MANQQIGGFMKIADALLLQKDLTEEVARLRRLAQAEGWEYRTSDPNAKWVTTFNLEENLNKVKHLTKLHRRLSRAITKANNTTELDIDDSDYQEWL